MHCRSSLLAPSHKRKQNIWLSAFKMEGQKLLRYACATCNSAYTDSFLQQNRTVIEFLSLQAKKGAGSATLSMVRITPWNILINAFWTLHKCILSRTESNAIPIGICSCKICRCLPQGLKRRCRCGGLCFCSFSGTFSNLFPGAKVLTTCFLFLSNFPDWPITILTQVTELPFFASKVRLGRTGAEEVYQLGPLNEYER